jgi:hypothetical protein
MSCCYTERMTTNDGQVEIMNDKSPDVGLGEIVGERLANPFSTKTWQHPKYGRTRTEIADRTDELQTKVARSRCGFPYGYGMSVSVHNLGGFGIRRGYERTVRNSGSAI